MEEAICRLHVKRLRKHLGFSFAQIFHKHLTNNRLIISEMIPDQNGGQDLTREMVAIRITQDWLERNSGLLSAVEANNKSRTHVSNCCSPICVAAQKKNRILESYLKEGQTHPVFWVIVHLSNYESGGEIHFLVDGGASRAVVPMIPFIEELVNPNGIWIWP